MSVAQITKLCTLKCTYCFDRVHQDDAKKSKNIMMDREVFKNYLAKKTEFFHGRNEEKSICISGGEPTVHPFFKEMINDAIHSGFKIYLLSNFTFDEKTQKFIKGWMDKGKLASMTNINSPTDDYAGMTDTFWDRTLKNLEALQRKEIRVSLNVFDPNLTYDFIFDILRDFPKLDKTVRVGIENMILPAIKKRKEYVFEGETWERYKKLGKKIDGIVDKMHGMGKNIYLDCGAGWCVFGDKTIDTIKEKGGIIHGCNLPSDEVSIKGDYSACYAIYDYGNEDKKLKVQEVGINKSRMHFILKTELFKRHYLILPKCQKCPLLEKGCPRFCVSNNIFYWHRVFDGLEISKDGKSNLKYSDKFLEKYFQIEKDYSLTEFLISKGRYEEGINFVKNLKIKDERIKLYEILLNFLLEIFDRKTSIKNFDDFMNNIGKEKIQLSDKDFQLVKFVDMFMKKYKIIK